MPLQQLIPSLLVRDMAATLAFYQRLGFQITGRSEDVPAPDWAEVTRDDVVLWFYTEPPVGTPSLPGCSGTFYILTDDLAGLVQELREAIPFVWGPETMDYGLTEVGIQDPNGYYLAFAQAEEEEMEDEAAEDFGDFGF